MTAMPFRVATLVAASLCLAGSAPALTLDEAKSQALARHPALAAAALRVDAAKARRRDAGRLANPVLSAEVENFGATSGRLETTLRLYQALELGGDRARRVDVADAQVAVLEADRRIEARVVLAETAERFVEAWAIEQRLDALKDAERLTAEGVRAADARHKAGAALVTERLRAEAQLALRTLERVRAESDLALARKRLAAQWGDSAATFGPLELSEEPDAPANDDPRNAKALAEVALERARLREAKAARVPDLALEFGVRRLAETGSTGFVAGVGLPLPLWNGQGAAVEAAEAERAAADARARASARAYAGERDAAIGRMASARASRDALTGMRPAAEEALRQVRDAYRAGRLGYSDLVEAQRAVREADLARTDAVIELWRARVALDRLTLEDR